MWALSGPEDGDILKHYLFKAPETTSFASMIFGGKSCPRLPEGLKKHR
jgi:hypothetical protein